MEGFIVLVVLFLLGTFGLFVFAVVESFKLRSSVAELKRKVAELEKRIETRPAPTPEPKRVIPPPLPKWLQEPPPAESIPPPVSGVGFQPTKSQSGSDHRQDADATINWESLVGVRLFAWIGGLAFFLGVVFFVKYAFERNLITPSMRVIIGAAVGIALILVSSLPKLRRYRIPAQSLCATGILILYADIYAAHGFYHLISLTAAMALMWVVTAFALILATQIDAQSVAWLALVGGFLTPFLVRIGYGNPILLFGYIAVLDCGIAAMSTWKRWNYLIVFAALGSVITEFIWAADYFEVTDPETARFVFLVFQGLFLLISIALTRGGRSDGWSLAAAAIAGFAPLLASRGVLVSWDRGFLEILLPAAGLIALASTHRHDEEKSNVVAAIVATTLGLVCLAEWKWWWSIFHDVGPNATNDAPLLVDGRIGTMAAWHIGILIIFLLTPYVCNEKRTWPWMIAAVAGVVQFAFVRHYLTDFLHLNGTPVIPRPWKWVVPLGFAIPPAIGMLYLVRRRGVPLVSGDSRLAGQGAAFLTFISLIFPVQFEREWITLGWAIEGVALILLFRWIPNRRLRAVALIVFSAAFIRLALNPAVLQYHPRTHTPILNWYLYTYGAAGLCFLFGAGWFGSPREKQYERFGPALLYTLGGIAFFLLLNIEIADYFSIGPTLTFSFAGNFARDMTYTISWALFAFVLLILGMIKQIRALRFAAVALLCVTLAKLFLHDLDALSQLYRIAAFISVAIIAIVASFAYQRFLSLAKK